MATENQKTVMGNGPARKGDPRFDEGEAEVYARSLRALNEAQIPFVIAGGFAYHAYTGIWRSTKDLDIFLKPEDLEPALATLSGAGFQTEIVASHWLAKAWMRPYLIDLIFGMGNGALDDQWTQRSNPVKICGVMARLIPIEEMIASKLFIAKRDRFDGADVVHLIRCMRGEIQWQRILELMSPDQELLLWHLILFDYVYPGHPEFLPRELMVELFEKMRSRWANPPENATKFRGTMIDELAFAVDLEDWGYCESGSDC